MKYHYEVEVVRLSEVHEIPDDWKPEDYRMLMKLIDYEDSDSVAPEELKEMAAMALSDLEPEEAAIQVLEIRLGEKLNKGQRKNLSEELKDERLWEEYANISYHEELFNVSYMLHAAFPKIFPEPDIVRIQVKVKALNKGSEENLQNPDASFICRLLNDGMNDHNTIYRLFDENIASGNFPESEHIIWKFDTESYSPEDSSAIFTIYTSWNWVDELKGVSSYDSSAYADGQKH